MEQYIDYIHRYKNTHYKDNTAMRPPYLYNGDLKWEFKQPKQTETIALTHCNIFHIWFIGWHSPYMVVSIHVNAARSIPDGLPDLSHISTSPCPAGR